VWYLIINKALFEGLPQDQQDKLVEVAGQFEQRRWDMAKADQAKDEKRLADYGAQIVPITDEQIASIAAKIKKEVWPAVLEDVGAEWGQTVLDSIVE